MKQSLNFYMLANFWVVLVNKFAKISLSSLKIKSLNQLEQTVQFPLHQLDDY